MTPICPHCQRPMQLNTAVSNERVKQFVCACTGSVYHANQYEIQRKGTR